VKHITRKNVHLGPWMKKEILEAISEKKQELS
jgi:hypothetical protein